MSTDLARRRDLGKILDASFALYRGHARTLLLATLAIVVPVDVIVVGFGMGWLSGGHDANPPIESAIVPTVLQLAVLTPLVTGVVVHTLRQEGRRASPGEALQAALTAAAPLIGTMLLVVAGMGIGFFAFIVPGVIVAIHWAVVLQVVLLEDVRGWDALRRSWALVSGTAWWTFGVLLVVNLLVSILGAAVTIPLDALASEADTQLVSLGGLILSHVLTLPFTALAVTLLYFSLRAKEQGADAAPAPAAEGPVASPVEAFGAPGSSAAEAFGPPTPPPAPAPSGEAWERRRAEGWEPPVPPAPPA